LARTADPRPASIMGVPAELPTALRYRSIARDFSVWGYDVHVERMVREFLDLTDVSAAGFTIQGSGHATIATAPRYRRGRTYVVSGATDAEQHVIADRDGRITIEVDLGPSHEFEQFSARANALEAAGDYWVVRLVGIE
jgi:hypothetical protein